MKLNDLENVVTLDRAVHHAFDKHLLFFKTSNHPNRDRVDAYDFGILGSCSGVQLPRDIVLRQHDARYPLPRKACLDWHYRMSRVFKTMKEPGRDRNKPNVQTIHSPPEDKHGPFGLSSLEKSTSIWNATASRTILEAYGKDNRLRNLPGMFINGCIDRETQNTRKGLRHRHQDIKG
jgi:hypothetical protein